eukprot:CAMPEP_0204608736 /NCGR_PEP_ID=MMETSP0661-20131031/60498_1 /ASSEMBLY_ACC=CAM_ASM_000606 /TAXON_ID=109239 /ORGANISM="Alexandrium margalefi, Strain AMGDE01CS-322" /LENGTH=140 /DNA_ID=CAMNT_0051620303 /DNA_START=54 /DNA_END=474 /DNA_ORIENTATION=+
MPCLPAPRLLALLLAALALAAGAELRSEERFTVNDKVIVDGVAFAEGAAIEASLGCHGHKGTPNFKVCGCGVKVVAHLMTECQAYKRYDTQVGKCDCSLSGCDEMTLTSGYTNKFEWKAASFEIAAAERAAAGVEVCSAG